MGWNSTSTTDVKAEIHQDSSRGGDSPTLKEREAQACIIDILYLINKLPKFNCHIQGTGLLLVALGLELGTFSTETKLEDKTVC